MNSFSYFLIILGFLLLGFVFRDFLKEAGLKKEITDSYLGVFLSAFLLLLGFAFIGFFMLLRIVPPSLMGFYGSEYFWSVISFMAGGFIRLFFEKVLW